MDKGNQARGIVSRPTPQHETRGGIVTTPKRAADLTDSEISEKMTAAPLTAREVVANARVFLRALFFDPRLSDDEMTVFESHYVKALENVPAWAARDAFSAMACDASRRALPRPGEVRAAAIRAMDPLRLEAKGRARASLPAPAAPSRDARKAAAARMEDAMDALRSAAGALKI